MSQRLIIRTTGQTGPTPPLPSAVVNRVTAAGTSLTLPAVSIAQVHDVTLNSASCALTFPTGAEGNAFTLILRQGTGNNTVTWPSMRWPFDVVPTLSTTAGAIDELSMLFIAGQWRGNLDVSYTS